MKHEKITVDGYEIPVAVAFKIHDRVEAFFNGDGIVPAIAIERPQPSKPASMKETRVGMTFLSANATRTLANLATACQRNHRLYGWAHKNFPKSAIQLGVKMSPQVQSEIANYFGRVKPITAITRLTKSLAKQKGGNNGK